MLLCGLNSCWWSVCVLQIIAYMLWELPTHTSHVCVGTSIWIAHYMTANVKPYPISPIFPKKPNIHLPDSLSSDEDNTQCWVSYTGFHHPLFLFSLLWEDPLCSEQPSPNTDEGMRKWLRAATAAHGRKQKYGSSDPWDHWAPDPDVWWDIIAVEYLNILICFKSTAKSPLKQL